MPRTLLSLLTIVPGRRARHFLRAGSCLGAWVLVSPSALAQGAQSLWVEGRLSTGVTFSSNGPQAQDASSEQVIEVSPGVRMVANGARVKGSLEYSLRAMHHFQGTSEEGLRHSLNAAGNAEVWDGRAYVDASAVASEEAVSAFGPVGGSGIADSNRAATFSYRFSPYLKGRLAGAADYELRYSLAGTDTRQSVRSDSLSQDLSLRLQGVFNGPLGWSVQAQSGTMDYSRDRETRSDSVRLNLNYSVSPQLMLTALAGLERNDVLSVQREAYNITGVGADWRPSPRSRLSMDLQKRYFGHSHNLQLEHRTGLTLWRLRDSRDVSNSPTQAATAYAGTLHELLYAYYQDTVPDDPVKLEQLVQAELLNLGLPGNLPVFQRFLSSSATLARTQSLSAILQGRRTVVTATLSRSRTTRLQSLISIGDDFDNTSHVVQQGLNLSVGHRLTPLTSVSADWSLQRNEGSLATQKTANTSLTLRLNTQLAPRTSGSVQWRRTVQDSPASPYRETSISGVVNHRF